MRKVYESFVCYPAVNIRLRSTGRLEKINQRRKPRRKNFFRIVDVYCMNKITRVYETMLLVVGLIYLWPISGVNIHPEETSLAFDSDSQKWLLTLSEELSTGMVVSFSISLVYGFYWFVNQEEFNKIR